jgi:CubicO group peptidase (beta-lactamase class C family)
MLFPKVEISVPLLSAALFCLAPCSLAQTISANQEEHIRKIEATAVNLSLDPNEPPLQMKLDKLMELFNVTGLSIAVIDDYKIAWAKGYGVTDMASNKPVTTKTLFQAGSISKPVAATGALFLSNKGSYCSMKTSIKS